MEDIYQLIAESSPALQRGLVRCQACGLEVLVNSAKAMREEWPLCCDQIMRLVTDGTPQ